MKPVTRLCSILGVDVGKEWEASDDNTYSITSTGELIKVEYKGKNKDYKEATVDNISKVLTGELQPIQKGGKALTIAAKVCELLSIKMEEEWLGSDGGLYKFDRQGNLLKYLANQEKWYREPYMVSRLLTEELHPVWRPKKEEVYYMPDLVAPELYHSMMWMGIEEDKEAYKKGLVFKTKEEAINMAKKAIEFIKEEAKR